MTTSRFFPLTLFPLLGILYSIEQISYNKNVYIKHVLILTLGVNFGPIVSQAKGQFSFYL